MFYPEAVEPTTLELIRKLQELPQFENFLLVGGTALALQIGHRKSKDIDLFSQHSFDPELTASLLEESFNFQLLYFQMNTLKGILNEISLDLISHNYPLISEVVTFNEIRMMSLPDIAAMKVNAISGNGTRIKDFIDMYFILKHMSYQSVIEAFGNKYGSRNEFHAIKSLTWFDDVDLQNWPEMILEPDLQFSRIKETIIKEQNAFFSY